jgi:ABC-type spermidine/putrescine transport system permease subunit II
MSKLLSTMKHLYVVLVAFILVAPFAFIFYRAVTYRTYLGVEFTGLKFFYELTPQYWSSLLNSIIIGITVALLDFFLAFPVAYALARYRFPLKRIIGAIFVVPMFTPDVVAGIGLMGVYIRYYGLYGSWLGTILGLASTSYPIMLLPLFASLKTLDPDYENVAKTLGASPLRVFGSVLIPLLAPAIFSGFVLTFVWCINNYLLPLFLTGGAIDLLAVKLYSDVRWWGLLGRVAAEASILQLATFLAVLLYIKMAGKRLLVGLAI